MVQRTEGNHASSQLAMEHIMCQMATRCAARCCERPARTRTCRLRNFSTAPECPPLPRSSGPRAIGQADGVCDFVKPNTYLFTLFCALTRTTLRLAAGVARATTNCGLDSVASICIVTVCCVI